MASDNPISVAVLAALYMIKAGNDDFQRYEFKKKMVEVALMKNFDKQKSFRLLNFVRHLMTLPESLETAFKEFTQLPKFEEKMPIDKETLMLFGGRAFREIQKEAREEGEARGEAKGEAKGEARGREQERELTIMTMRRNKGFTADLIADITNFSVQYVQSMIDKFEKKD